MANKKVLIVDDSQTNLKWATDQLQRRDIDVRGKRTAWIVNDLTEFKPDLILVDVRMGGLDGGELVQMLKKHEAAAKTKMVFYSGRTPQELERYVTKYGADGYICKTDDVNKFVNEVKRFLG